MLATAFAPSPGLAPAPGTAPIGSGFAPAGMVVTGGPPPAPIASPQAGTVMPVQTQLPNPNAPIPFGTAPAPPQPLPIAAQKLSPQQKGATSFPTPCPNPSCRKQVMVAPGGTAQCAFCGTLVDGQGAAIGAIAQGGFDLTGHVSPEAAERAAQLGGASAGAPEGARPAGPPRTVALQGTAPMVSSASLVGTAGNFKVLPGIEARVGRDGTLCTIALAEARISGVHATLKLEGATLMVRDDKSHNGTFVNGNRIPPGVWTPVPAGSQLRFGPIEFAVRVEG